MIPIFNKMRYFFGNAALSADVALLKTGTQHEAYMRNVIGEQLSATGVTIAHQVHGTQGNIITDIRSRSAYNVMNLTGDFLITNQSAVAIGILTADCVPIFLYDPQRQVIAAIHAGWRGTLSNIATHAIAAMRTTFNAKPATIHAFIGPHAHACCYAVGQEVIDALRVHAYSSMGLVQKDSAVHLSMENIIRAQLRTAGILTENIDSSSAYCTICTSGYHSFRKSKTSLRQINCIMIT